MRTYDDQVASGGISIEEIVSGALEAAHPETGLRWLDIGCGRGDLLRRIRDEWSPSGLWGIDPIDWLAEDLRGDVEFRTVAAETATDLPLVDRVMMVEVIEHLEAPWSALRAAARLVAPGGWIVVSTPNLARLRNRLELAVRGQFTSFRPDNEAHISPAPPHVTRRILGEEGLVAEEPRFAGRDVISLTGGRTWPRGVRERVPVLTSVLGDHCRTAALRLALRCDKLLEGIEHPSPHGGVGELCGEDLSSRIAELPSQLWRGDQRLEGIGERGGLPRGCKDAGDSVLDELGGAARADRDDGDPPRHPLEQDDPEGLGIGGVDEDVHPLDFGARIGHLAGQLDVAREIELCDETWQRGCVVA